MTSLAWIFYQRVLRIFSSLTNIPNDVASTKKTAKSADLDDVSDFYKMYLSTIKMVFCSIQHSRKAFGPAFQNLTQVELGNPQYYKDKSATLHHCLFEMKLLSITILLGKYVKNYKFGAKVLFVWRSFTFEILITGITIFTLFFNIGTE